MSINVHPYAAWTTYSKAPHSLRELHLGQLVVWPAQELCVYPFGDLTGSRAEQRSLTRSTALNLGKLRYFKLLLSDDRNLAGYPRLWTSGSDIVSLDLRAFIRRIGLRQCRSSTILSTVSD